MDDRSRQIEAMYQLEVCMDGSTPPDAIFTRICAAHYLIQAMLDGYRPENYEEIMRMAHALDKGAVPVGESVH